MSEATATQENLSSDFGKVMDDIDSLVSATTNKAESEVKALRTRIRERLDATKERVLDAQHEALDKAKRAAHATDDYVHLHPWQAVGVAAAVGVAIGVLIARR